MQKPTTEPIRYSPFWVCLAVFLALAVDSGLRFSNLSSQRSQLDVAEADRAKNATRVTQMIAQRDQIEGRLQALSMDLMRIAQTNGPARQIIQEFNIQWAQPPTPAPVAPASASPIPPKK